MNTYSYLPLLAAIAYIPLLVITFTNRPWQKNSLLFTLFLVAGMAWSTCIFFLRSDLFADYKLILFRLTTLFYYWFIVQFYFFIRYYLYRNAGWGTYIGYAALLIVAVGSALGYIPQSLIVENGKVSPQFGAWTIPIFIVPYTLAFYSLYLLIRRFISSFDPMERNRIIYLFCTVSLLLIFGAINTTPLGETVPTAQIGQFANAALLTYATLRYHILDMNLIIRRSLVYGVMIAICVLTFSLWLLLIGFVLNIEINFAVSIAAGTLTGITAITVWARMTGFLYRKIDEIFYGESFDFRQKLSDFARRGITHIFSLEELFKELLPIMVRVLDCKNVYMLLPESTYKDFKVRFTEPLHQLKTNLIIRTEGPIPTWLKKNNRYLNIHNIEIAPEFQGLWKKERDDIADLGIEIFFPLISRDNLVGILALSGKKTGKYTLDETNLVEDIAAQIAISVEKEYIQAELKQNEQELSLINRLTVVMTSSLNIRDVYDVFIQHLREVIDISFASVTLSENENIVLAALFTEVGWKRNVGDNIPLRGTSFEWVQKYKKSLFEPDLAKDRMFDTGTEYLSCGIHSIVYLPLITKGEVIGCLNIASKTSNAYSQSQISLLNRLASQISTSVANAQLYARAEQRARVDELTGLFNRRHFDESLKLEISRHSRYGNVFSVVMIDLDNFKTYNDKIGHTAGDKLLNQISVQIKSGLRNTDLAYRYGGDEFAIIMPHTKAEDAYGVAERIRLKISNQTKLDKIFVTCSIGIASWPADGIAQVDIINAADKALYYTKQTGGNRTCLVSQMLPAATGETLDLFPTSEKETLSTIYALAATIEARDPYTYGHSRKVRTYAVSLAESLGLSSDKVAIISHAALLHDIGKIGVTDDILKKKQKLNPKEQKAIRYHPQLSKTIVGHIPSLTACLPAVLHHHEKWDGTGYPYGIKGEAIPLEARILAIADAFDAMTSLRPYRAPLSYKEAIMELRQNAGKQFDPDLVEKFIPIALTTSAEEVEAMENPQIN